MSVEIHHVWPVDGIKDLSSDWERLSIPSMRSVEQQWLERLEVMKGSEELAEFNVRLQREWAIETGQIENLYDIEQGVTVNLINQGFDAGLIPHGSVIETQVMLRNS